MEGPADIHPEAGHPRRRSEKPQLTAKPGAHSVAWQRHAPWRASSLAGIGGGGVANSPKPLGP